MNTNSSLGDRIKDYESVSHFHLTKKMPVMIRVDGRAFHTFTRGCQKPFDHAIMSAMVDAAKEVASSMSGFKAGYVQSDEATFCLTDYDTIKTESWFGNDLSKIVSISASLMSVYFNQFYQMYSSDTERLAVFDSRAFNIPQYDVVNAFLWRAKDWSRNSVQMYARAFFSHKALHGKKIPDIHEMLNEEGKNWSTDCSNLEKNGTFLIKSEDGIECRTHIVPRHESVYEAIGHLFEYPE